MGLHRTSRKIANITPPLLITTPEAKGLETRLLQRCAEFRDQKYNIAKDASLGHSNTKLLPLCMVKLDCIKHFIETLHWLIFWVCILQCCPLKSMLTVIIQGHGSHILPRGITELQFSPAASLPPPDTMFSCPGLSTMAVPARH